MSAPADCPKTMTYGPCGGVRADGTCEVDAALVCPFLDPPLPVWSGPSPTDTSVKHTRVCLTNPSPHQPPTNPAAARLRDRLREGGVVVADLPARALDAESLRDCAAVLSRLDAVLAGDAPNHRVQFPPAYRAGVLAATGATPWPGLNCRDRNAVALEAELAALADLGVGAVHCVTGDHTASGHRPDATPVFDLDSTELVARAAGRGFLISVGESPAAPPVERRPVRLLSKQHAGADICFVDHCGGMTPVTEFINACRAIGSTAAMIACVPLICDAGSAAQLLSFGVPAPRFEFFERILAAEDPRAAGIAATVELGCRLLDTGLISGLNLSGGPADGAELDYAHAQAEAAEALTR